MKKWQVSDSDEISLSEIGIVMSRAGEREQLLLGRDLAVTLAREILRTWGTGPEMAHEELVLQRARARNLGGRWKP